MKHPEHFVEQWQAALRSWLRDRSEASLAAAYDLGRRALREGVGLLALSEIHATALQSIGISEASHGLRFFAEALAPSELALGAYRDTAAQLRQLASSLESRVEQRTAELAAAELRYRTLIEQLPVVTYVASPAPDEPLLFVGPQVEALTGYSREEWQALGGRFGGRLHPGDAERVSSELERSQQERTTFRSEYRLLRKDGRVSWVRDEARWTGDEGVPLQRGIWLDVTEMRALEDRLRQAQKLDAIGRLAGGVAHDFNNVLTAILTFGGFVLEDLGPANPSYGDVQEILSSAQRGAALTRQLLSFGRKDAFSPRTVEVDRVFQSMEQMLTRLIGERVRLKFASVDDLFPVHADPSHLEQILLNLVVNAADAMVNGGQIAVELSNARLSPEQTPGALGAPEGDYLLIAVSDTGVGMDPETQARIFEPFFTTKEKGKGTGLGLATVYGLVRQLRGDIRVYSHLGRGTTFKVYLPRSWEEPAETGAAITSDAHRGHETVLVAEDDPTVREGAVRALRRAGFNVLDADSLQAAAETAARCEPGEIQLLVTDIILGSDTGPELFTTLARQSPDLPVLFMSGYTAKALEGFGMQLSEDSFIDKPFTSAALLQKVRRLLDLRSGK